MSVSGKFGRRYLMASAATGLAITMAMSASAQDADESAVEAQDEEAVLDKVTVTGIRGSIQNSLLAKKNATSIVEAISAEDIGKLPDVSIADSLARLPGVTAQRVRGRAQQISIRGLGPDFSLALLNGREVVSAGNNRGIEFDQFPSELISQGIVYKTPDAKLAATGIAGAVDLRTVRPLDFNERQINLSGKYVFNSQDQLNPDFDSDGYRLFGSYIDQNADGTVGWSLGVTVQSNPTQFASRELKTNSGQTGVDPATGLVYPTDNPRTGAVSREFERTSIAGALQFEPNDRWSTSIDAFYTDTEDSGIFRGLETPIASWSGAQLVETTGTSGFADTAVYTDVVPILRTDTEGNTAEIFAIGLNTEYQFTDRLSVMLDVSNSTLDRSDIDYESYAGTGFNRSGAQDTLAYIFDSDGEYNIQSVLDYTDPSVVLLTDPGGWGQVGFIKRPQIDDELSQIRLEADYELENSFISGIEAGILYSDREKNFDSNEDFIRSGPGFVNNELAIPSNAIIGQTDGGFGLDIIAYNPASFLSDGTYTLEKATFDTEWRVAEEIMTLYAMANIDSEFNGVPVRGNLGFQYIDTEQSSTGTLAGLGTQTVTEDYTNFLPSLNLSFEVAPDTFIRAAASQSITRARLDQLAANQSISANVVACPDTNADGTPDSAVGHNPPATTCYSLNGGNPFLRPYESTNFDLAFERYFGEVSAFSFAVFHKEIDNWVENNPSLINASQQIVAIGDGAFLDANPQVATARLDGPDNFATGTITGFEATLRLSLDEYLPENLQGFGVNASYTYADGEIEEDGRSFDIPGYSETTWSGDIYYENHGWRTRLSARHRSDFLSEVPLFDGSLAGADAQSETVLDAQIGYEFEGGPLDGFSVNLEAYNITDEPFVTENITADPSVTFPSRHELYGTTYNITVAKKF